MSTPKFDADFHEFPDGTVTVVVRAAWPSMDDAVEVLRRSHRRGPQRVDAFLREPSRNCGGNP